MKLLSRKTFIIGLVALLAVVAVQVTRTPSLHTEGAVRDAVDVYIYGYPLVTFDMARKQQTNVEKADEQHAPMGQMIKMRTYLPIDNHCCAAPNADTLYTIAWLDAGPCCDTLVFRAHRSLQVGAVREDPGRVAH